MELYYIRKPTSAPVPVLANILHSGVHVPDEVAEQFSDQQLKSRVMTDWHLDELYDFLPELGVTSLGVRAPFFLGCHSLANLGFASSKLCFRMASTTIVEARPH